LHVTGVVLHVDGTPAPRAIVTVRNPGGFLANVTSREDGRFDVIVARNYYDLTAELDGARTLAERVDLRHPEWPDVVLRFPGAFALEGEVVDEDGKPMVGAQVRSWREFHPDLTFRTAADDELGRTASGPDGRFTIHVRRLARYQIVASADGFANSELVWTETTAAQPHPFLRLQVRAFAMIAGVLRSTDGVLLPGYMVTADPESDLQAGSGGSIPGRGDVFAQSRAATTDANARFQLHVQPGVSWSLATWSAGAFITRIGSLRNVIPGSRNLELVVPAALLTHSTIRGRVVRALDDSPVEKFIVELALLDGDRAPSLRTCKPVVNGNEFVLPDVPADQHYVLQVEPEMRQGAWAPLRLEPFTTSATAETVLRIRMPEWGELPVHVLPAEGETVEGIQCATSPDILTRSWRQFVQVDAEGRAAIQQIPPGAYDLWLLRDHKRIVEQPVLVRPGLNPEIVVRVPKLAPAASGR
jgi:hypothetical protein